MIELHDFQVREVQQLREAFRGGARAPLLVAPTGSGKTVVFSYMARNHISRPGRRVLILVHRQELIDQVADTLNRFEVRHGYWCPGTRPSANDRVIVGSVFTVVRSVALGWMPSLIIVDEAHHAVDSTTWGRVLQHYGCHVLGVTATPVRLSGEGLGESFDTLIHGPTTQELIERGYLCRFRTFCPSAPDLSRVHRRMGEYVTKDLASACDRPALTGDAVAHYRRHADGRQAVAFCVSVEHAHHVAESFRGAGYQAAHIDGSVPSNHRFEMVRDFRERRLKVLTSCDLISEGFDVPSIEVGISLRPTQSLGMWLQQMGRCLRTAPGKEEAILLDHAGNAMRHGLPSEPREWTLNGCKSASADDRAPSVRICPKCWAAMASHVRRCVQCGSEFEVIPRTVGKKAGELEEMTADQIAALRYKETEVDKRSLEVLTALGQRRGYKDPAAWARHVLEGQQKKKVRKVRAQEELPL